MGSKNKKQVNNNNNKHQSETEEGENETSSRPSSKGPISSESRKVQPQQSSNNNNNDKSNKHKPKRELSSFAKTILVVYNLALFLLWLYIFAETAAFLCGTSIKKMVIEGKIPSVDNNIKKQKLSFGSLYAEHGNYLQLAQLAGFGEIFFILICWIPSSVFPALLQSTVRTMVIFFAMTPLSIVPTQGSWVGIIVFAVWSLADAIRYLFYFFNLITNGNSPSAVVYWRYTAFLVLYPAGFLCEMRLLHLSLSYWEKTQKHSIKNDFGIAVGNFSPAYIFYFPYFIYFILAMFPPGFWSLYSYMLSQRKKVLGKKKSD